MATQAVIEFGSWALDPHLPPVPWKGDIFREFSQRSLVIGVMLDDGMVKVHPPVERIFNEMTKKLEAAGHELVPWDSSLNAECITIMVRRNPMLGARQN